MVKTSPSKAEGVGLIPGQGAKISHGLGPKTQNIKKKKKKTNPEAILQSIQ